MLGVLAAVSILGSEMALAVALPAALVALGDGWWLARRELRRPAHVLVISGRDGGALLDGAVVTDFEVQWRGPLAFVQWRNGQGLRQRVQLWPDRLPARSRRELRLAMIQRATAPAAGSMAP